VCNLKKTNEIDSIMIILTKKGQAVKDLKVLHKANNFAP